MKIMNDLYYMNSDYLELQKIVGNLLDSPGAGGNISVKSNDSILVKSSGADMKKSHKMAFIDNATHCTVENISDELILSSDYIKPTMEIGLHTSIKAKYVMHYHPVYVLPYLCSDVIYNYYEKYCIIDYCNPGTDLNKNINKAFEHGLNEDSGIILLKNHGIVIYGNDISIIKELYKEIKDEFFEHNEKCYTPDDIVDVNSPELYLFRLAMNYISDKYNFKLNELSEETKDYLLNDINEKHRQQMMKEKQ